jgi:hypothetical protein
MNQKKASKICKELEKALLAKYNTNFNGYVQIAHLFLNHRDCNIFKTLDEYLITVTIFISPKVSVVEDDGVLYFGLDLNKVLTEVDRENYSEDRMLIRKVLKEYPNSALAEELGRNGISGCNGSELNRFYRMDFYKNIIVSGFDYLETQHVCDFVLSKDRLLKLSNRKLLPILYFDMKDKASPESGYVYESYITKGKDGYVKSNKHFYDRVPEIVFDFRVKNKRLPNGLLDCTFNGSKEEVY